MHWVHSESVLAVQAFAYCPWAQTVITAQDQQAVAPVEATQLLAAQTTHAEAPGADV